GRSRASGSCASCCAGRGRRRRASARPAPSRSGSACSCGRSTPSPARAPCGASCARGRIAGRVPSLLHPQELLHCLHVDLRDGMALAEVALTLRRLLREFVALHRVTALQLPRRAHLEPLLRPAPCLHLRHLVSPLRSSSARAPSPCCDFRSWACARPC